jgi:hypothetical protein
MIKSRAHYRISEQIEERLGLLVDPVQVFEDHDQQLI